MEGAVYKYEEKLWKEQTSFRTMIVGLDSLAALLTPSLHLIDSWPIPLSFHASLSAGSLDWMQETLNHWDGHHKIKLNWNKSRQNKCCLKTIVTYGSINLHCNIASYKKIPLHIVCTSLHAQLVHLSLLTSWLMDC